MQERRGCRSGGAGWGAGRVRSSAQRLPVCAPPLAQGGPKPGTIEFTRLLVATVGRAYKWVAGGANGGARGGTERAHPVPTCTHSCVHRTPPPSPHPPRYVYNLDEVAGVPWQDYYSRK